MKPFESTLGPHLEAYIAYRQSIGYSERSLRSILRQFDLYACTKHATLEDMSSPFFIELKDQLRRHPDRFNRLLQVTRGLFKFLVRSQIVTDNPLSHIHGYARNAYVPFVFSDKQTEQLLVCLENRIRKEPRYFFADFTRYTAIVLLARCGLRISEPLRLKLGHYDSSRGTIYIEKTKFSKDRLIPIPGAVITQMNNYLAVRTLFVDDTNPYLVAGKGGGVLSQNSVRKAFDRAVADVGCSEAKRVIGNTTFGKPTPHSLRHSFAINTLARIKSQGGSAQHALPVLSAYLGHSKYRYTAVYLKVLDARQRQGLVDFVTSRQEEL